MVVGRASGVGSRYVLAALLCASCTVEAREDSNVAYWAAAIYNGMPSSRWSDVVRVGGDCSGVVIHPRLVVYAAHCGAGARTIELGDGRTLDSWQCQAFPEAAYGGTDIAYCLLDEAIDGLELVPPATGCEFDEVAAGAEAVIVGFGQLDADSGIGVRREAVASVTEVGTELRIERPGVGTCAGDSGGAAYMRIASAWRLVGILSSGETADCGDGPSYFTPITPFLPWLEQETGLDVTPCGSATGDWEPTLGCRDHSKLNELDGGNDRYSDTCGTPVDRIVTAGRIAIPASASCNVARSRDCSCLRWAHIFLSVALLYMRRRARHWFVV